MKPVLIIPAVLAAALLTGCKGSVQQRVDPCQVNPTYQAQDGRWYEADGEPLDSDPCDSEDLEEDGFGHKKPTSKPKLVTTKPAPKVTRR